VKITAHMVEEWKHEDNSDTVFFFAYVSCIAR